MIVNSHITQMTETIKNDPELCCEECNLVCDSTDELYDHLGMGPLAPGHNLHFMVPQNSTLLCLIVTALFMTSKDKVLICTQCSFNCSTRHTLSLYKHCREHGLQFETGNLGEDISGFAFADTAVDFIKKTDPSKRLHVCIECSAVFNSITELFVHLKIVSHKIPHEGFCSLCCEGKSNLLHHIVTRHKQNLGGNILPDWFVPTDNVQLGNLVERYIKAEISGKGFSNMANNIMTKTAFFDKNIDFSDSTAFDNDNIFPRQEIILALPESLSTYGLEMDKVSLPSSQYDFNWRLGMKLLPDPAPIDIASDLAKQFPGFLNSFIPMPAYTPLENNFWMHENATNTLSMNQVFPPTVTTYPVVLYGSCILRNILLFHEGVSVSHNLTDREVRYWPTHITNAIPSINTGNKTICANMEFFTRLYELTSYFQKYQGLFVVECNIQDILQRDGSNPQLIFNLARGFIYGLTHWKNRPRNIAIVGAINSLSGKIFTNGCHIATFNALIKTWAEENNCIFLDPTYLAAKSMLNAENTWITLRPSGNLAPRFIFTYAGEKTVSGTTVYQNWLAQFYILMRDIATQLRLPLRKSVILD